MNAQFVRRLRISIALLIFISVSSFALIVGEVLLDLGECQASLYARKSADLYGIWVWHCDVHERHLGVSEAFVESILSPFAPRARLFSMWTSALMGMSLATRLRSRRLLITCALLTLPAWCALYILCR